VVLVGLQKRNLYQRRAAATTGSARIVFWDLPTSTADNNQLYDDVAVARILGLVIIIIIIISTGNF